MKDINLEYESDINGSCICMKLNSEEELDKISYLVIQHDCPDFLIPFKKSVSNGQVQLKYQMNMNWTALKYSINTGITKAKFISMMQSIIEPLMNGADWFLKANNFAIDLESIYVDKNEKLYFLYLPIKDEVVSAKEIMDFVKYFANTIEITDDPKFQVACMKLFNDANVNLGMVETFLDEQKVHTNVTEPIKAASAPTQSQVSKPVAPTSKVEAPKAEPVAPVSKVEAPKVEPKAPAKEQPMDARAMLLGNSKPDKKKKEKPQKEEKVKSQKEKKGFGLFGKKKEEAPVIPQPVAPAPQLSPEPQPAPKPVPEPEPVKEVKVDVLSNDTVIFDDAMMNSSAYLQLISSVVEGAPERIDLEFDKEFILIGRVSKDTPVPDVAFSSTFKGIGRRHAIIEREGNTYYLIDQGSSNKTLINGTELIPNKKYQLQDGDEISFTIMMPVKYRVCLG